MSSACTGAEATLVEDILHRVASDLAMICDRELDVDVHSVEKHAERTVGKGGIHISFRLGFEQEDKRTHGCLLMPLPDAISLACYLMMVPDDSVKGKRSLKDIDESIKDAMLEVGNFIGGAADAALRESSSVVAKVSSEGCQGVRPNVRPALCYNEGEGLVVGRARSTIHEYPEFEMILMLPELEGLE